MQERREKSFALLSMNIVMSYYLDVAQTLLKTTTTKQ